MQDGVVFSESIARNIAVNDEEIDVESLIPTNISLKFALSTGAITCDVSLSRFECSEVFDFP